MFWEKILTQSMNIISSLYGLNLGEFDALIEETRKVFLVLKQLSDSQYFNR